MVEFGGMGMESEPTEEWVLLLSWVGEVKENCRGTIWMAVFSCH